MALNIHQFKITQLINILNQPTFFGANWNMVPPGSSESAQKGIWVNKIIRTSSEILKFSILWLLSGKYSLQTKSNRFVEIGVELLHEKLIEISNQFELIADLDVKYEIQSCFNRNVLFVFNTQIKRKLLYFERDIKNQFQLEANETIVRGVLKDDQINNIDQDVKAYLRGFLCVFNVTYIEHFKYESRRTVIRELLLIGHEIKSLSIDEDLKKAVGVKVNFLLKKILYREIDGSNSTLTYSFFDGDDITLDLDIEIDDNLQEWDDIIRVHYGIDTHYKIKQRKRARECENENAKFQYFHAKMKILKDDKKDEKGAFALIEDFRKKDESRFLVDNYAFKITESYLFNNCISLKLEDQSLKLNDFIILYNDIRNHQNSVQIKNYFPWKKLADSIEKKMEHLSNKLIDQKSFVEFVEFLRLLDKVVENKLEECWNWCKEKKFLPFQFPYRECLSSYKISISGYSDVNLFFLSSFILPIDYKVDDKDRIELKMKRTKYEALKSVYEKLHVVIEEVNDSSDKIKKQERRSIEILAIFSGVALFSVGSIQIFGQNQVGNDPNVYYKFIIAFGYSLALFVILIWLITRDNIRKISIGHIVVILFLFITGFFVIGEAIGGDFLKILNKFSSPKR